MPVNRRTFLKQGLRYAGCGTILLWSGCTFLQDQRPAANSGATPDQNPDERFLKETMHYEQLSENRTRCEICFRNCVIDDGQRGLCRNRENRGGTLYNIVYGRPSAVNVDPVEKEPQHHFLPGTQILCLGTAGCNFRCKFCHNYHLSQQSIEEIGYFRELTPREAVEMAQQRNVPSISFTYNEPTTFYEYMYDVARLAKEEGLGIIFHSNGAMNPEPLRNLLAYTDAVTIDLKAFEDSFYREISQAELQPVLKTIQIISEEGVWLELVNLVVTSLNDEPETIRKMCAWIRETIGTDYPLHFSRFFPSYRLTDLSPTPVSRLEKAHSIAREEGIRFVSIGNVPGHAHNSTFCPECGETLIRRHHFTVGENNITDGSCSFCGEAIPGVWSL